MSRGLNAGAQGRVARGLMLAGLVAALPLLVLWATGSLGAIAQWAAEGQRDAQNALARAIRALRAGEAGALAGLLGLAFAYGVFHAAGPGHGKVLIGGYGVARRVRLVPLAALALASSLAQAAVAVALVYAGVLVFDWTRERMVGMAEGAMLAASHLAVAAIGLWLAWRGVRGLRRLAARDHGLGRDHGHDHGHHHHHDDHCGHAHGPSVEDAARVTNMREALALIAGVAARPCTGALFLLVLTWQMGIGAAGIAGTFAMGLGTAFVTVAVAGLSVWAREGMLAALSDGWIARALPVLELAAGLVIAAISISLWRGMV